MQFCKFLPSLIIVCLANCLFPLVAVAGEPSNDEQLWLELINRFRADPVAELDLMANYTVPGGTTFASPSSDDPNVASAINFFNVDAAVLRQQFNALTPAPPLAWNPQLGDSATYYSNVMIAQDAQSHTLDGLGLFDRFQIHGGYTVSGGGSAGENIFAFTENVQQGHAGFLIDWGFTSTGIQDPPGHRNSLINPTFREIGIGMIPESNSSTSVGPNVVTQHLAADFADGPFLTGVVFDDAIETDLFYSVGEGIGGLVVDVSPAGQTNVVYSTTTFASGGYTIDMGAGLYDVRIHGGEFDHTFANVQILSGTNAKLDWIAAASPGLAGDYNGDLIVDAADYTAWRDNLGTSTPVGTYSEWAANYGATGSATNSVPEPASLLITSLGMGCFIARPRCR